MHEATLCIPVKEGPILEVLMGETIGGMRPGTINFSGGKVNSAEMLDSPEVRRKKCASRELYEEIAVRVAAEDWQEVADLTFRWPKKMPWDQRVFVYMSRTWSGTPTASSELRPIWVPVNAIQYEKMWPADKLWLPHVLAGKYVTGSFVYDRSKSLIAHEIRPRPL